MKKCLFILLLLCTGLSLHARKWDSLYINKLLLQGETDKVLQYYLSEYPNGITASRIAELYVLSKDFPKAIQWFERDSTILPTSKNLLTAYAEACRITGQCARFYNVALRHAATTDIVYINTLYTHCEQMLQSSMQMATYEFDNYAYNTGSDESYISVLRNHPVFIRRENTGAPQVWQVVRQYQQFAPPVSVYKNSVGAWNIRSISFSKDGNTVAFAAVQPDGLQKIFLADYLGGQLLNVRPFPHYVAGSIQQTPALNAKANELYFASNQSGGYGKMDIWKSKLENGQWSKPENAGDRINSTASESSPFLLSGQTEQLFFVSDKPGGVGGFDIYKATHKGNSWQSVEWLPAPINSEADEMSIIFDPAVKTGYFTSDRSGGKGGFDVYRYVPQQVTLRLQLTDSATAQPLGFAAWKLFAEERLLGEGITNDDGEAYMAVADKKNGRIEIQKEQYKDAVQSISWLQASVGDTLAVSLKIVPVSAPATLQPVQSPVIIQIQGRIVDSLTGQPVKGASLRMYNLTSRKIREVDVDATGRFSIALFSGQEYEWLVKTAQQEWQVEYSTKSETMANTLHIEVMCGQKAFIRTSLQDKP